MNGFVKVTKDVEKDFTSFLKRQGVFEEFSKNVVESFKDHKWNDKKVDFNVYVSSMDVENPNFIADNGLNLVNNAFRWGKTDEGVKFWGKISSKWINKLNKTK